MASRARTVKHRRRRRSSLAARAADPRPLRSAADIALATDDAYTLAVLSLVADLERDGRAKCVRCPWIHTKAGEAAAAAGKVRKRHKDAWVVKVRTEETFMHFMVPAAEVTDKAVAAFDLLEEARRAHAQGVGWHAVPKDVVEEAVGAVSRWHTHGRVMEARTFKTPAHRALTHSRSLA